MKVVVAMVESAGSVAVVGAGIIGWRSKYSTDKKLLILRKTVFPPVPNG